MLFGVSDYSEPQFSARVEYFERKHESEKKMVRTEDCLSKLKKYLSKVKDFIKYGRFGRGRGHDSEAHVVTLKQ